MAVEGGGQQEKGGEEARRGGGRGVKKSNKDYNYKKSRTRGYKTPVLVKGTVVTK